MFDMANIRNQCSWVHSKEHAAATAKAKDLVRMAVARVAKLEPLHTSEVDIEHTGLVIGGGAAGMTAALTLAQAGFGVHLVERESQLGGQLRHVFSTVEGGNPQAYLRDLIGQVEREPRLTVHRSCEVVETEGFMGNLTSTLRTALGQEQRVRHAVTILATGGQEYRGDVYGYGSSPRVLTGMEFESLLAFADGKEESPLPRARETYELLASSLPESVAMILCVGPAERFCGRICCSTALKNALALKARKPEADITLFYRDLRTYGFKEQLFTRARELGIRFVRYEEDRRPEVSGDREGLAVTFTDPQLGLPLTLNPDLVMLSMPVVPSEGAKELASALKVALDGDGFFLEAHVKLRPVDFSSDGFFMAGMAHYPKLIGEAVVQARAAASRAGRVLSQEKLTAGGAIAQVDPDKCVGCLTCVRVCPFDVPKVQSERAGVGGILGAAYIEPTICHGCGSCAAECPAKAIQLLHYQDDQIMVKMDALMGKSWS
jgi:heterodisulfide reductase subunit A-like polyferredoxin